MKSTSSLPTERGPALLGTMAKHFGHKIPVTASDSQALFDFQDGTATLALTPTGLALEIEAPSPDLVQRLCGVIESHLIRFAHREDPQPLIWSDPA